MRSPLISTLAAVTVLGLLEAPQAGAVAFHNSAEMVCSGCHTMHFSQDGDAPAYGEAGGPWDYALLKSDSVYICLTCHDNNQQMTAPDVVEADVNGLAQRAAGHFLAVDTVSSKGHNLGPGESGPSLCLRCHFGGDFDTAKVTCVDCHDPHSNANYRNLRWPTAPGSEPEIRALENPAAADLDRYEEANVRYPAPASASGPWREVTNICFDCHHNLTGVSNYDPDGNSIHNKHISTDSEQNVFARIDVGGGDADPAHWAGGSGSGFDIARLRFIVQGATTFADAGVVDGDNQIFCLSCHRAHGSDDELNVVWNYDGGQNSGCQQCHNK